MNATQRVQVPFGLKKKLLAATSMLLVAAIMLVSTSYAWFTLSTAPEITGITTSVGANGNLEIALLNGLTYDDPSQITSNTGDSMSAQALTEANITWGNLVDLSDASYGLDKIALYPSALNVIDAKIGLAPLSVPEYGADGRVNVLSANTTTGVYDPVNALFSAEADIDEYGVRAVGTADNVSPRQITFKSAKSMFTSKAANAKSATRTAVASNYTVFISMASGADSYNYTQVSAMKTIATGVQTSLNNIVAAYANAGLAKAAATTSISDELVATLSTALSGKTSASELKATLNTAGVTAYNTELDALAEQQTAVAGAIAVANELLKLGEGASYDDTSFSYPAENPTYTDTRANAVKELVAKPILGGSANIEAYGADGGKLDNNDLDPADALNIKALYLTGGAMGAVATYTGAFKAADVSVPGMVELSINVGAKTGGTNKLGTLATEVDALKAPGDTNATTNITTYYGYILDFAVRTNAAGSNLLLQTEAINRVYENTTDANLATMGNGSTATFTYDVDSGITAEKATKILDAVRVVFFDPSADGTVLKYAKFTDIDAGATSATAKLQLHDVINEEVTKYTLGKDAYVAEYTLDTAAYPAANATTQYTNYNAGPLTEEAYNALGPVTDSTTDGEGETAVTTHTLGKDAYKVSYKINPEFKISVSETTATGTTTTEVAPSAANCWNYEATVTALQYKYLDAESTALAKKEVTYTPSDSEAIMALNQNQAHKISVLVYLDGEGIDNSAVAATALSSGTLDLNLQFASDADLVPMENNALKNMEKTSD